MKAINRTDSSLKYGYDVSNYSYIIPSQVRGEAQFTQVVLYLLNPCFLRSSWLLLPSTMMLFILLTGKSRVFLCTCPNHLNLFSRIFVDSRATPNFNLSSWFLSLSTIMLFHIHLSISISATFIFYSWIFLTGQHFVSYNKDGLIAVLKNLPFSLIENFLTHNTPIAALHLSQPACIRCITLPSISPLLWKSTLDTWTFSYLRLHLLQLLHLEHYLAHCH